MFSIQLFVFRNASSFLKPFKCFGLIKRFFKTFDLTIPRFLDLGIIILRTIPNRYELCLIIIIIEATQS